MSGFDKTQYYSLERLLSSDLNLDARLRARIPMDMFKLIGANVELNTDNDAAVDQSVKNQVFGGLRVIPGTGGVAVTAGLLGMLWSGGGAQPSLDESQYVIGAQREVVSVPIAVPGADTWYLVQARPTTSTTNVSRDIWDPGTETFGGSSVAYKVENVVEISVKTGTTTNLPVPDVGWIPLGGVKRLASGVDSTTKELVDLRPLYDRKNVSVQTRGIAWIDSNLRTAHYDAQGATAGNTVSFGIQAEDDTSYFFARSSGSNFIDVTSAPFIDPNTPGVLAANTWYYLYVAVWGVNGFTGSPPRAAYDNVVHQGLLFLSHVAPTSQGSNDMPDGVTYPAPFSSDPSRVGICVGMLKRNAANDGWVACQIVGSRMLLLTTDELIAASPAAFGAGKFPMNARRAAAVVALLTGASDYVDIASPSQTMRRVSTPNVLQGTPTSFPLTGLTAANIQVVAQNAADLVSATITELEF